MSEISVIVRDMATGVILPDPCLECGFGAYLPDLATDLSVVSVYSHRPGQLTGLF